MLMELFIETLTGVSFEIRASPMETIMSIKHKIQRSEGIPVSQQHLIWKNSELDDHRRLRDYEIGGGSTLRLVLGLRGGPLNAHRIPPLRLTPIRLTPSSHSATKYTAHYPGRLKQLPRFTLPSLPTRSLPTGKIPTDCHSHSTKMSSSETVDELGNKTVSSLEDNCVNIRHLFSRLRPLDKDKKADGLSSLDLPSNVPFSVNGISDNTPPGSFLSLANVTSIDKPNVSNDPLGTTASLNEICSQSSSTKKPMSSNPEIYGRLEELSSLADHLNQSGHTKVQSSDSIQHGSLDRKSGNNSRTGNNFGRGAAATGEHSVLNRRAERCINSPPGYPPLFTSNLFHRHLGLSDFDIHSRWRLYESPGLASNTLLSRLRSDNPPVAGTDEDNGATPATATDQNGIGRSSSINQKSQSNGPLSTDLSCDELSLSTGTAAAGGYPTTPAATLLAGLFSSATDHSHRVPFQTSGTEHSLSRLDSYPFHWLRQASPLLEASELPERSLDTTGLWDADEFDDCEAIAGIPFDLDTDDPDEDDDCSDELKPSYPCDLDDEDDVDSLADLEEYLFYYHTGGLLFGPSSLAADYASHHRYGLRDHWRDFDAESASVEMENTESVKYQDNIAWHQERSQLMEKVKDLKGRMKELKIRRQKRRLVLNEDPNTLTSEQLDTPSNLCNENSIANDPILDGSTCMPSEANSIPVFKKSNDSPLSSTLCEQTPHSAKQPCAFQLDGGRPKNIGTSEDIKRHRRFGTVTPPVLSCLMTGSGSIPAHSLPSSYTSNRSRAFIAPTDCFQPNPLLPEPLKPQLSSIHSSTPAIADLCTPDANTSIAPKDYRTASSIELRSSSNNPTRKINVSTSSTSDDETKRAGLLICKKRQKSSTATPAVPFLPSLSKSPTGLVTSLIDMVQSTGGNRIPPITSLTADQSSSTRTPVVCSTSFIQPIRVVLPLSPRTDSSTVPPRSPPKPNRSPILKRRRCSLCLRKTGLANSYACRCGRNFCSRHRYAEVHSCQFDYKAEARRVLLNANPVVTAPKLPKI